MGRKVGRIKKHNKYKVNKDDEQEVVEMREGEEWIEVDYGIENDGLAEEIPGTYYIMHEEYYGGNLTSMGGDQINVSGCRPTAYGKPSGRQRHGVW